MCDRRRLARSDAWSYEQTKVALEQIRVSVKTDIFTLYFYLQSVGFFFTLLLWRV